MAHIDGMIVQHEGSKPHVVYIMKTLAATFPNVIWKIGGKVERTTWGGGFSAHSAGRACDIYLDAGDPLDKKLGDLLFDMFERHGYNFKVDHAIWNSRTWSREKGGGPYKGTGGAHRDHVHVAFQDDRLDQIPTGFSWICQEYVAKAYVRSGGDAEDRMAGLYGKAFDPKRPNKRLSQKQRKKVLLANMGMKGA